MIRTVTVIECTCEKCGKSWIPRTCPECKNTGWNRPRKDYVARANEEEKARSIEPEPEPIEEEPETITVQTIAEDTPVETPKPAKRTKRSAPTPKQPSKGLRMCRHGFAVVDGITMCKACA